MCSFGALAAPMFALASALLATGCQAQNASDSWVAANCRSSWCSSPVGFLRPGVDCWAGNPMKPCSCTVGRARATGAMRTTTSFPRVVLHEYTCCADGPARSSQCGDYRGGLPQIAVLLLGVAGCSASALCWAAVRLWTCPIRQWLVRGGRGDRDESKAQGPALRDRVPPHSWCVTRSDLREFRCRVRLAVRDGSVRPTDRDDFDIRDERIGPCIHTVNDQLIKPVLAVAGHESWALMHHPEGLPCDLFITHGWDEGIYEFIEKALYSWPRGARHAFICMLSMPQNSNVGGLIDKPRESPFAEALHAARCVLAVPNRRCSIYTRIWCIYEAHLASLWGKPIFIATAPVSNIYSRVARVFLCTCGAAFGLRQIGAFTVMELLGMPEAVAFEMQRRVSTALALALCTLEVLLHRIECRPRWSDALNYGIAVSCGCCAGNILYLAARLGMRLSFWILICLYLAAPSFVCVERILFSKRRQEAADLLTGFNGKLRDAKSSKEADKERILEDISVTGEEQVVEDAIAVLVSAGMCTPHIREASELLGHPIGPSEWSVLALYASFAGFFCIPLMDLLEWEMCRGPFRWLNWVTMTEGLACLGLLLWLPRDRKGCAANASFLFFPMVLAAFLSAFGPLPPCIGQQVAAFFVGPLVITISLAGPAGVARFPYLGPPLVRLLMNRGRTCSCRAATGSYDQVEKNTSIVTGSTCSDDQVEKNTSIVTRSTRSDGEVEKNTSIVSV